VIVERPRLGSRERGKGKGYGRNVEGLAWENQPRREGIKRLSGGGKVLNEHLAPLRRYLMSQTGRHWDKVFSEICAHINRNSAVQDHVRDHVFDYVALHVKLVDGVLYHAAGFWIDQPLGGRFSRQTLYVCPRTGLLKRIKKMQRRRDRYRIEPPPPRPVQRDADHYYCFVRGTWHLVRVRRYPPVRMSFAEKPEDRRPWDVALARQISRADAVAFYGAAVHGVEIVRPLTKRELSFLPVRSAKPPAA